MHIHCFGASVTAQSVARNGDMNGYVDCLSAMCKTNHVKVTRSAFGSCQFYNMGKFAFNSCLEGSPDILMFDWHTTGEHNHSISQWVSIVRACLLKGTLPVILVLPRRDIDLSLQKYHILNLLNSISLVIDLSNLKDYEVILRDVVHTTEKGAISYAHLVWDSIKCLALNSDALLRQICVYASALASFSDYECSVQYSCHPIPAFASHLDQTSRLIVGLSSPSDVGVWGTKDFQVGDIKLWEPFKSKSTIYQVFDQWCYYASGDFQERCRRLAPIQAACRKSNSSLAVVASGGSLIHTTAGCCQQRMDLDQRLGCCSRACS